MVLLVQVTGHHPRLPWMARAQICNRASQRLQICGPFRSPAALTSKYKRLSNAEVSAIRSQAILRHRVQKTGWSSVPHHIKPMRNPPTNRSRYSLLHMIPLSLNRPTASLWSTRSASSRPTHQPRNIEISCSMGYARTRIPTVKSSLPIYFTCHLCRQ